MGMSVSSIDELRALEGHDIGYSSWVEVGQSRIDGFADVTDDHQWIHTDAERAKDGPFGQTVAQRISHTFPCHPDVERTTQRRRSKH